MNNIPASIVSGDSARWTDTDLEDVTSSEWTLTYYLRGPATLDVQGVAFAGGWNFSITTAQSATLTAGAYSFSAVATKTGERKTLGSGSLTVAPNIASAGAGFDGRSQAKKDLDAVQAAIRTIISGGAVQSYSIGNRSLSKMPMADLLALESKLKAEVFREGRADSIRKGLGDPRTLKVRFNRAK